MSASRQALAWFVLFASWWLTLWWLSSRVNHMPPSLGFQASDKVLHFGYFALGGFLLGLGLSGLWGGKARGHRWLLGFAVLATTGAIDEVHQAFVPGRSGHDFFDFLADLAGAAAGLLAAEVLGKFRLPRR